MFFASSCGKDGAMGPQGEKGDQGISGKDGSTILSGTSNPNTSVGQKGDFYLNLKSGDLFGPKTSEGWGTPYNMKGDKGEAGNNGKDGTTILNGTIPPTPSLGKEGDFYINTKDFTIYGPKMQNGDWGNPVSLKSNTDNNITYFYIYPKFENTVNKDGNNFEIKTKLYILPGINNKYMKLSYLLGSRLDIPPINISTNWKDLYSENTLPNYIPLTLDYGFTNSVLFVTGGYVDGDGNANIIFRLKGSYNGNMQYIPQSIPNFIIMIQTYDRKDGGVIAKDDSSLNRYLSVQKISK